ncbi:HU family DNA-binding protein [Campylobacter sp.]|uniref:HU family DNA-binding protein n=1 Tax=Campylobacter sp. TaxID=205 RepID=UPI0025C42FDE|nr:HU family DNA-binding protein [Campylobacter sp.]
MTKADFISQVAQTAGLTKKDATAATDAVIATITDVLTKGDSISFIGFGTFSVVERAARTARVPSTGKTIDVPATKVAKFKVGKNLKDVVAASKATKKAKK